MLTRRRISGTVVRTPGQYSKADSETGEQLIGYPLKNTCERIHPSIRIRLASTPNTFGIDDEGPYLAEALTAGNGPFWSHLIGHKRVHRSGWKLVRNNTNSPLEWKSEFEYETAPPLFYWKKEGDTMDYMVEDLLGKYELALLEIHMPGVALDSAPAGLLYVDAEF
jgi:hypothetical protein